MINWQERRNAVLEGAGEAAAIHKQLSLRSRRDHDKRPVDVYRVIKEMDIRFLFQPLQNLLGAFIKTPKNDGILITTQRDLYVQRYTAAHELGHFVLKHEAKLDDERLIDFSSQKRFLEDSQEIAADSFASEFLMPRWLVAAHVRRQGWTAEQLRVPTNVYQLSLRLGVSYQAMCWSLASHKAISRDDSQQLATIPPKKSKQDILYGPYLKQSWANVWSLTLNDSGITLVGTPEDVIQIDLLERASAGLTWNVDGIQEQGFEILADTRRVDGGIGNFGRRRFVLRGSGRGKLCITEARQWDPESKQKNTFGFRYFLEGKESGLPRVCRDRSR